MITAARLLLRPLAGFRRVRAAPAPTRRVRAVRSLVWGALAFALATAAFAAAVETVLPQVRDPEYGLRLVRVRALQRAHPDRPLVLVLGTSRTQNALDPHAMNFPDEPGAPLVFNFGQSGSRLPQSRLTLQRLRADGVRPAAVLIEVLPATLMVGGSNDDLLCVEPARLSAGDVRFLEPALGNPAGLWRRWGAARATPWSTHRVALVSQLAPELQPWDKRIDHLWVLTDERGFSAYPFPTVSDEDRQRRRAQAFGAYWQATRYLRVSELMARTVRELVGDCRTAGVPVAFYLAPESPVFRSWYAPEARAELAAFTGTLRAELGCPVFEPATDFGEEDFADGHHMLRAGAARFSRELAERHLKPWLANSR